MHSIAVWDDLDRQRKVMMRVNYRFQSSGIRVRQVTPVEVEFPRQGRSIRIWTEGARKILLRQFRRSGEFESMVRQLEELAFSGAV